jgi:hypothetical protein
VRPTMMKTYFIKIALRGVSPMVWRRIQINAKASLVMLHECIQIVNDWDDFNLHQFHIYGKDYGNNDTADVYFGDFSFDVGDKFTYEYNFFEHIMHDIRIEKIQTLSQSHNHIICMSGSGMPGTTKYDFIKIKYKILKSIIRKKGLLTEKDIINFRKKMNRVKFNKRQANISLSSITIQ